MTVIPVISDHLDYFQRSRIDFSGIPSKASRTNVPLQFRKLVKIIGTGYTQNLKPISQGRQTEYSNEKNELITSIGSEDILSGLYGSNIPIAFIVKGSPEGISIYMGTWSGTGGSASSENQNRRIEITQSLLSSLYSGIQFEEAATPGFDLLNIAGMVLGIPTLKPDREGNFQTPFDRLIRSMYGTNWACLVIAESVIESVVNELRKGIINEIRNIQTEVKHENTPNPLADHYCELLDKHLKKLVSGLAIGSWRTAVYLLGDEFSYYRLASLWRSIFSGDVSILEPIHVRENENTIQLAKDWSMPDVNGHEGPSSCLYHHPFEYQTLLTSKELAAYIHLPTYETAGFSIKQIPIFDMVRSSVEGDTIFTIGNIIERGITTHKQYEINDGSLNRHALITGVTGVGKTNTLFHLLTQLWDKKIPFLVLEPAKTEYRSLICDPALKNDIRIFTLGEENTAPFRINPFAVEEGVPIATHIDLLKSVFNASFNLWDPLPQILERSLHEIYQDCGWDPIRSSNFRMTDESTGVVTYTDESFPTITALHDKVREIIASLNYDKEVASRIQAALLTRLNSLRIGGKGNMLDTQSSIPTKDLLSKPTIIELEQLGDDDEKAFIMGILFIRIYEYLRLSGSIEGKKLEHVVVIEEAHRLLANVPMNSPDGGSNVKGKAVESFANMLAEVRAYGEGFLIAEQIPEKLTPDIIKNTNLKITHRIVSGPDRILMGQSMNLDEGQSALFSILNTGEAVLFSEGDDKPILVKVPSKKQKVPEEMRNKLSSNEVIRRHMTDYYHQEGKRSLFQPNTGCLAACNSSYRYCDIGRQILDKPQMQLNFAEFITSIVTSNGVIANDCRKISASIRYLLPQHQIHPESILCVVLHGVKWYFQYFGRKYGWPYRQVDRMKYLLTNLLMEEIPRSGYNEQDDGLNDHPIFNEFISLYRKACIRQANPYLNCNQICPDGLCLFRFHVALLFSKDEYNKRFEEAYGLASGNNDWGHFDPASSAISHFARSGQDNETRRSIGLCYCMQRISLRDGLFIEAKYQTVKSIIEAFDQDQEEGEE